MQVKPNPDGSFTFDRGRRFLRKGIHVLHLQGDRFEMAFQHGRLMKDEIVAGALPAAARAIYNTIANQIGVIPIVTNAVANAYYRKVTERMYESALIPQRDFNKAPMLDGYGLSEGSGLPLKEVVYGAFGPESLSVMLGQYLAGKEPLGGLLGPNACSSFVAWGDSTENGETIIGRNTDYPLNGRYDRFPTVLYFNPTDGMQKYMAITSAGLHNAGVVGLNEAGIYLDVHTIPTLDVSPQGTPVFLIAQEVLRQAKNFEDAIRIFKIRKPAAGWTYVMVSTRERKVATLELSHSGMAIRPIDGDWLIQTNHYSTEDMKPKFEPVNIATETDSRARYRRVESLLQQHRGRIDAKIAASILADKFDVESGEVRALGNTVAVHTTMTSVVALLDQGKIYIANGTAPVSQNEYVGFPIVSLNPDTFANEPVTSFPNNQFHLSYPEKSQGEQHFIQAKIAFEDHLDREAAKRHLRQAIKLDDTSPGYTFNLALLELLTKEWKAAEATLKKLAERNEIHYRNVGRYYLARLYAHHGSKAKAKQELDFLLKNADPAAETKLLNSVHALDAKLQTLSKVKIKLMDLPLMFQQADMIQYK